MIIIVIILPMFIVKGCGFTQDDISQEPLQDGVRIKVYISSENRVEDMLLEEYLKGVVAAEMPAEFELEALKAQAVAARTYAYARMKKIYTPKEDKHNGGDICTDSTHCQAWISKECAMEKWDILTAPNNWNKIEKAVADTRDILITYDNYIVNPVFHSNSGGKTENAEDVWEGNGVPYLKSVLSEGEEESLQYKTEILIKVDDFCKTLKNENPDINLNEKDLLKEIEILNYTQGGRVKTIKIGSVNFKGTDLRKIFSLKSANFKIEKVDNNMLKITCFGNGHGVGMSQWGANYLAKQGKNYEEILKYYYTGISLSNIEEYELIH